jgi:peptide/nickel transport system ATP-binding protein
VNIAPEEPAPEGPVRPDDSTDDGRYSSASDLLEVTDLRTEVSTRRGIYKAVDGVSLRIKAGETVGLVGESGSGKTMTGMSIMRLLPHGGRITGGSVKLKGRELTSLDDHEMDEVRGHKIGVVFQDPMTALNPTMTIGDQVAEPVQVHLKVAKKEAIKRAGDVLNLVGMPKPLERLNDYPYQLSGGLRQRVVIAMALACEPDLLIADEPTTALDVTIQAQILALLDDLKARLNMGMLLITHDMGVVADRADRVMVMYGGQIVESCPTWTVFNEIRHPYTEALLKSVPHLEMDRQKVLHSIPGSPPDLSRLPAGCRFAPRCGRAHARCREDEPTLTGEPEHRYACFFPVDEPSPGAVDVVPPDGQSVRLGISERRPQGPTGSPDQPLLVLDHVVKEFPVRRGVFRHQVGSVKAVSDVSLEIAKGETFGLVGESGSGKTTLGRLIVALEKPTSGSITFEGVELARLKGNQLRRRRGEFQIMFQDPYASLDPRMRVLSIVSEPLASLQLASRQTQRRRAGELLDEVGLPASALDLYPHQFSGGQRQRIGLARALIVEPRLIVADEPVSALDVSIQSQVLNMMKNIQAEHGLTYIVISHDLSVVRYLADRIGVMYLGKLVEVGPGDEVYHRPAHPYTAGLLASVPAAAPGKEPGHQKVAVTGELPSAANPPTGCRFRTRCPMARQICAEQEPLLRPFNEPGHRAACHFPLQTPLAVGNDPVTGGGSAAALAPT